MKITGRVVYASLVRVYAPLGSPSLVRVYTPTLNKKLAHGNKPLPLSYIIGVAANKGTVFLSLEFQGV